MSTPDDSLIKRHEGRDDLAGEYKHGDAIQMLLFVLFAAALLLDVSWLVLFSRLRELVSWAVRIPVSIPFLVCSVLLFRSSHQEIFEIKRERTTVISSGAFAVVRHPMYLGAILLYVVALVLSLSMAAFTVWLIAIAFYYYISRFEESILVARLGIDYEAYRSRVPMFIPRWRKRSK